MPVWIASVCVYECAVFDPLNLVTYLSTHACEDCACVRVCVRVSVYTRTHTQGNYQTIVSVNFWLE